MTSVFVVTEKQSNIYTSRIFNENNCRKRETNPQYL